MVQQQCFVMAFIDMFTHAITLARFPYFGDPEGRGNELPRGRAHEVSGFRPADDQYFRCWIPIVILSDPEGREINPH